MVFLSWGRPSNEQQKQVIDQTGGFNYDNKYRGASAMSVDKLKGDEELGKDGFLINHARVLVGSGRETYEKGKKALRSWRHFGLDWAFVDPATPVENGRKVCVCVKEVLPWVMLPLQVVYVDESRKSGKGAARFGFGGGTLQGHLLAGEERFSIELDANGKVWYEILSLSKPAHFLSFLGYPYVKFRQRFLFRGRLFVNKKFVHEVQRVLSMMKIGMSEFAAETDRKVSTTREGDHISSGNSHRRNVVPNMEPEVH